MCAIGPTKKMVLTILPINSIQKTDGEKKLTSRTTIDTNNAGIE
jgi:hypothetical protein